MPESRGGRSSDGADGETPAESSAGSTGGAARAESVDGGRGGGALAESSPDRPGPALPEGFAAKRAGEGSPAEPSPDDHGAEPPEGTASNPPAPAWPPAEAPTHPSVHHPDAGLPTETSVSAPGTPYASGWPADSGWPPRDDHPNDHPDDPHTTRARRLWPVLAAAAVVGVAVGFALVFVLGGDGSGGRRNTAQGSSSSAPAPTGTTESAATASPSPSAPQPPEGYDVREDDEGFRIAVPERWTRSTAPSTYGIAVVNYRSPDRSHRMQIYQVAEQSPDASFELYLSAETRKPNGFEKLSLRNMDEGDFTGSRLEYLADTIRGEPEVGTWHVLDERFVAADGRIYAVAVYGPDADGRADELELLTTALSWFCPPDTGCDASASVD
ncbi:hypothetical protein [Streptomyces sp. NPDC059575]|uniref:hypothetical protein n=1 Tax=Streptomyces sp. NPDC059575 TaxID=3346872 RepID=UPI0036B26C14